MSVPDSIRSIASTVLASQSSELLQTVGPGFGASTQQKLLGVVILAVVGTYGRDRPLRDRL
ncbi:hypothetical protein [Rugosimonospora africana]|nr:hypothetical protein [Rugosimonospora africana]